jgi:hypothetical protein
MSITKRCVGVWDIPTYEVTGWESSLVMLVRGRNKLEVQRMEHEPGYPYNKGGGGLSSSTEERFAILTLICAPALAPPAQQNHFYVVAERECASLGRSAVPLQGRLQLIII